MDQDADELRQEIVETRERMGDTADAIAYKTDVPHRMQDAVSDRVDEMKSAIKESVAQAGYAVSSVGQRAADMVPDIHSVQSGTRNAISAIRENPLGLFFGVAAVGFLIGSLLPATQLENDQLGPVADQLKERAKGRVQGTIEAARDAAVTTMNNAMS